MAATIPVLHYITTVYA